MNESTPLSPQSEPSRGPKSICVYCGAATGTAVIYRRVAADLGKLLATEDIRLIYGGGRVGLMGILADAALSNGGKVTGIIPSHLNESEVGHPFVSELVVVKNMHQRKQMMFDRSDAFVVLPGGIGTLDETFEMVTWRQLQLHEKPVVVLDVDGYWQPFLAMIDHIIETGFARPSLRQLFTVVSDLNQVLPAIRAGIGDPRIKV